MAWTTMHFAVGMACSGLGGLVAATWLRRGHRWIPLGMTLGGIWALAPDLPRIFREDFPHLPYAATLGSRGLEQTLHAWGDLFFFHARLDAQPHEYALHGLILILLLYNLAIIGLMWSEHRQRNSLANRAWRAHARNTSAAERAALRLQRPPQTPLDAAIQEAHRRRAG